MSSKYESRKGPYVGKIKTEFCIASSRGHSTGYFDAKIKMSRTIFDRVIANFVIQNMHYEKLSLSKLIPKFYIKLYAKLEISHSFR